MGYFLFTLNRYGTFPDSQFIVTKASIEIEGLEARLEKLVYRFDPDNAVQGRPHIFIYFLTIANNSLETVTILGRRWVIQGRDGRTYIIEGDGIVGERPRLRPGESYAFNSFHMLSSGAVATGSFHGVDSAGRHIMVRIPTFNMQVPA
jgi:ApaG protein